VGAVALRAVAGDRPTFRFCTGSPVSGDRRAELEWLPGYQGSKPVRVGNAGPSSCNSTSYGEVIDASTRRTSEAERRRQLWSLIRKLLDWLADGWRQEDAVSGRCAAGAPFTTRR